MTRDEALELIAAVAGQPIDANEPLAGLGDSLELLFVINEIEGALDREIPNMELVGFSTAGDLADWIAA